MNWYHVSPADAWWFSEKDRLLCTLGNLTFFRVPQCHWQWKLRNGLTIWMWVFKWFWFKSKIPIFEIHCWIPWSYSIWISAKKSDICGYKGTPFFFLKKNFFFMWTILKSLLNLLQYCFCFMSWFFGHEAWGVSAPWPEMEPTFPTLEGELWLEGLQGSP